MSSHRFAVFDIEAPTGWDRFGFACSLTSNGEAQTHQTLDGLQQWVEAYDGRVWAHNGGLYDFSFLRGKDEVLLAGARVLRAKLGRARLCDSYPLFQMSLKKAGKAVGLEKLEVDASRLSELTFAEQEEYCQRDCAVLVEALQAHRVFCEGVPARRVAWPGTSGATAVYCAEAWEGDTARHLSRHPLGFEEHVRHAETVAGGRCELWHLGPVAGPIYIYDVKSSYPSRYLEGPMPVGPWRHVGHEVHGAPGATYRVRFRQPTDRLPLLHSGGTFVHRGEGWATSEELTAARVELGADVEVLEGYVPGRCLDFGRAFVAELYRLKEAGSPFAKVCINSLHGKLGQGLLSAVERRTPHGYVRDEELTLPQWFQRPLLEGALLARARLALWRAMDALRRVGARVYYTDTDSCHTDATPAEFSRVATIGLAPGHWELKDTASEACYLAPKTYAYRRVDGTEFVASKGFPPKALSLKLLKAAWDSPLEVDAIEGLEGFRTRGDNPAQAKAHRRTLSAHPGTGKRREGSNVWYEV